jgi:hypothetical protein
MTWADDPICEACGTMPDLLCDCGRCPQCCDCSFQELLEEADEGEAWKDEDA